LDDLRGSLRRAGFPDDGKPWVPHLTVGRVKSSHTLEAWPPPSVKAEFVVGEVVLMESHLGANGPRYESLHQVSAKP
jgi:2'-5' RNA ligase